MIKINNKIKQLVQDITSLYLAKGVQPFELVESAFDDCYESFDIQKKNGKLQLTLAFVDVDEDWKSHVKMRYTYDQNQKLLRIEQKIDSSRYLTQWDRGSKMRGLVSCLETELKSVNSSMVVSKTLDSLPDDIASAVAPKLTLVA